MTEVQVTYQTSLDGELRAFLTQQLVKYLLFIRGQVPCLYDDLLHVVETFHRQQQQQVKKQPNPQRLPRDRGMNKAVKCIEACENLFRVQLAAAFSLKVKRVALVFGSSMMSPREAVLVEFDNVDDSWSRMPPDAALHRLDEVETSREALQTLTSPPPPMIREKLMRLCAQKLVRALFMHSMEHFACALPATKLHIAVLAERQHTRIPGFLPKQQFKLRLPKMKRGIRTHHLTIRSSNVSRKPSQQEDSLYPAAKQTISDDASIVANDTGVGSASVQTSANTCESGMVWYVLEKPIAGFSEVMNTLGGQ